MDRERLLVPAPQLDVFRLVGPLARLLHAHPPPELARLAALRLAELERRFLPERALRRLDELPDAADPPHPTLQPAVVRAHALLERQQLGEAALLLPDAPVEAGVRDLLLARMAALRPDLDAALEDVDAALQCARASDDLLAPEVVAEALMLRGRVRLARREPALDDWAELETLCHAVRAPLTLTMAHTLADLERSGRLRELGDQLAAVSRRTFEARYTRDHEADRHRVAPIPLHVHGAAKEHARDPGAYVEAILTSSALAWRVGDRVPAYETAQYGLRLGERLFGARAADPLRAFLTELEAPLSDDEIARLRQAVTERARRTNPADR